MPGLIALGIALHSWADTFSHEGFIGAHDPRNKRENSNFRPTIGHADAPEGGRYPDRPYHDVPKAMAAARSIFEILATEARLRGYAKYSRFVGARPWAAIERSVRRLFAFQGTLEERADRWRGAILADFGEDARYESLLVDASWMTVFQSRSEEQRLFVLGLEKTEP
jgi:hypothetical protein